MAGNSSDVATAAAVGQLLSRIGRGERLDEQGDLSADVISALKRHCYARRNRFEAEIEKVLRSGRYRIARAKFHKMLCCPSVRLAALFAADVRRMAAERASIRKTGGNPAAITATPFAELCRLLPQVRIIGRNARGRLKFIPKDDGEKRPIVSFGLADSACGILLKHALTPFARAHPQLCCHNGQYMLAGGAHAACRTLMEALAEAPPEAVFLQVDVKRFYEHINIERLCQFTGLSQEVIRGFISAGDLVKRDAYAQWEANKALFSIPIEVRMATAGSETTGGALGRMDRCIAPGSAASSIVGEMVMGHVLRDACARISPALYLGCYSDNIGMLLPDRTAASAVLVALRDVLEGHPAGPFRIGRSSVKPVSGGFSFLGYRFERTNRGVVAHPRARALERFFYHHAHNLMAASTSDFLYWMPKLLSEVKSFSGAFPLWQGRKVWTDKQVAEIFDFLVVHCREQGLSPYSTVSGSDWPKVSAAERRLDAASKPFRWTTPPTGPKGSPRIPMPERL